MESEWLFSEEGGRAHFFFPWKSSQVHMAQVDFCSLLGLLRERWCWPAMGLASGSTNPYVILQPQAGTWVHPPIHPFTHPHSYSSSSIFLLTSVYLPAHLSLSPSRVHTFTHPPVHHVSRPHILSPIQSSSHTTSQLSFHIFFSYSFINSHSSILHPSTYLFIIVCIRQRIWKIIFAL